MTQSGPGGDREPGDREPDAWVGWGGADDTDEPDADEDARLDAEHRRTKRGALIGLGIVVVIVAVTIVLVRLVDTGTGRPDNPTDAAREWGVALVHGDKTRRLQLECPSGTDTSIFVRPYTHGTGNVRAEPAIHVGPGEWHVRLHLPGMTSDGYVVRVVRDRHEYDVC